MFFQLLTSIALVFIGISIIMIARILKKKA